MEYRTMNRIELAALMDISIGTLKRKMEKKLEPEFLEEIKGEILLANHVQHIYEKLSGTNKKWSKAQK